MFRFSTRRVLVPVGRDLAARPPRRQVLVAAAAALWCVSSSGGEAPARADRFNALRRPALRLRDPGRAVVLAATRAGSRTVAVGERGLVLWSEDDAPVWRQADVPVSVTLTAVAFEDERRGWAVGHGGVILGTQDGGEHWQLQADGGRLAALAESAAEAAAQAGVPGADRLLRNARQLVEDGPDKPLLDVRVISAGHLVTVGAYGLAFESRDGGAHWECLMGRLDNPKALHLYAANVQGVTWTLVGEQGLLLRSVNDGHSFERLTSPYAGSLFSVVTPRPGLWLIGGLRGHVLVSHDDAAHWRLLEGLPPASVIQAQALDDARVLLANQAGQLLLVNLDQGPSVKPLSVPPLPALTGVLPVPGGSLIVMSLNGVQRMPWSAS